MVFNETFLLDAFARASKDLEERACQIEIIKLILQDTDPEETLSQPRRNLQANLSGIRSQQKCLQDIEGKFKTDISISDVETALTQAKSEIQNAEDIAFLKSMKSDHVASYGCFDKITQAFKKKKRC